MENVNLCSIQFWQRWQKFPAKYENISCENKQLWCKGKTTIWKIQLVNVDVRSELGPMHVGKYASE